MLTEVPDFLHYQSCAVGSGQCRGVTCDLSQWECLHIKGLLHGLQASSVLTGSILAAVTVWRHLRQVKSTRLLNMQ